VPAAELVDGPLAGDPEHPRLEAAAGIVAVPVPPDLVEHTLQHILGLVAGHEAAQVAEDHGAEGGIALVDRPLLAGGESGPPGRAGALLHSFPSSAFARGRADGFGEMGCQGPPSASRCSASARTRRRSSDTSAA